MVDVDVNGNPSDANLVRVQLDAEYERDWTIQIAAPIFATGAPLIATGPGAGLAPSADNVDVLIQYGGASGVAQEAKIDYPTRGKTIGVRGSSVLVSLVTHARTGPLKDPCKLFAEVVDAPPPSLNREALPTWTGDPFDTVVPPGFNILTIPPRAVEVALAFTGFGAFPVAFTAELHAASASLSALLQAFSWPAAFAAPAAGTSTYVLPFVPIPEWAQGLRLDNVSAVVNLVPIFRIAP